MGKLIKQMRLWRESSRIIFSSGEQNKEKMKFHKMALGEISARGWTTMSSTDNHWIQDRRDK